MSVNYYQRLIKAEKEIFKLKNAMMVFRLRLKTLNIGDTIYKYGGYDEYYPQIVTKIDLEQYTVHTYEESINESHVLTSFSIKENGKFVDVY